MAESKSQPKPKYKIPKTFGAVADRLYELKEQRLLQQKVVNAIEEEEKFLKAHIIETMAKSETGAAGHLARVSLELKTIPQLKDPDKFYAFLKKSGRFDLMQRRLNDKAIEELWETKKEVPGIEPFTVKVVRVNKL